MFWVFFVVIVLVVTIIAIMPPAVNISPAGGSVQERACILKKQDTISISIEHKKYNLEKYHKYNCYWDNNKNYSKIENNGEGTKPTIITVPLTSGIHKLTVIKSFLGIKEVYYYEIK